LKNISANYNFTWLAVGLVLLLFIGALVDHLPGNLAPMIVQAATVAALLIATFSLQGNRPRFIVSIVFTVIVSLLVVGSMALENTGFSYAHLLIMLCFFGWVTWQVTQKALFTGTIDSNKIVGTICIYMLLGLIWAMLYLLIAELVPGAFNGLPQAPWLDNFANAVYFSFVTITTLGYGDISPALPLPRFLVYMEAIAGVFYMAILVASLIGIRISDREAARN
jgi:voltage-gated potassium channel Kch